MLRNMSDAELMWMRDTLNVRIGAHNAQVLLAQIQLAMLRVELRLETERRKQNSVLPVADASSLKNR